MRSTWTLGLASMAVLGLAACNRAQPPAAPASAEAPAAAAEPATTAEGPVESLPASEARQPIAPPPPAEAVRDAPDIGYAADFDRSIEQGGDYDAWTYEQDGRQTRAWEDPRQGWRIVEPGRDGDRIYYYRPGAPEPYLVREGGIFFVFSSGRLQQAYDARGRSVTITVEMRDRRARDLVDSARRARQQAQRTERSQDRRDDRKDDRRDERRDTGPTPTPPSAKPAPAPAPQPEPQRPGGGVNHPGRDHDRNGPLPAPVNPKPNRPASTPAPSAAPPAAAGQPINPRPQRPDRPARPAASATPPVKATQPAAKPAATPKPAAKPAEAKKSATDKAAKCERREDKGKPAKPGCP